ncbi:MAG: hypothetical protein ACI9WS_002808 [Paraglaciecola psychrophila]|jgi:hypothetical protein
MTRSIKAALLSALVFPGLGHFYTRKPLLGFIFSSIAAVCLYLLFSIVMDIALQMQAGLESGEIPMDLLHIQTMIAEKIASEERYNVNALSFILLLDWLVAVVDAFRQGRQDSV